MIKAALIGSEQLVSRLEHMPKDVRDELRKTVTAIAIEMTAKVKADKLSGQVLNVRTGRLRRSINFDVSENNSSVIGSVGTNVEYAKYHEYGEAQHGGARGILQALQRAALPPSVNGLPPRSFLRSTLYQMKQDITDKLGEAVHKAAKELNK